MTLDHGALSLKAVGTTNTAGRAVTMGRTGRQQVVFSVGFPGGGSTKCSVRAQVQGPGSGSTRWTSIGSAATTIKSTQAGLPFKSTSATPFSRARLLLVTRTTGATSAADTVSGWITGA
jgi:hypothetical protein